MKICTVVSQSLSTATRKREVLHQAYGDYMYMYKTNLGKYIQFML